MDGNLERTAMLRLKRTAENLQKNGMETHILQRREEVVPWLKSFIPEGAAVAHGGSMTLSECGVIDLLKTGRYRYIDRDREGITPEERVEAMREALLSDVYLLSANALIENGDLQRRRQRQPDGCLPLRPPEGGLCHRRE